MDLDKLDQVHSTVIQLSSEFDDSCSNLTKKDHMAAMIGEQPSGDITILALNICKNKGNYFKRLISEREKAVTKAKKEFENVKNEVQQLVIPELVIRRRKHGLKRVVLNFHCLY